MKSSTSKNVLFGLSRQNNGSVFCFDLGPVLVDSCCFALPVPGGLCLDVSGGGAAVRHAH